MAFFSNPQQAQLMAQMFQNPQGGGMAAPQPGSGGVGQGSMNLAPSFMGLDGAQGVQNLPFTGSAPSFDMGPFVPGSPTGIQDLGMGQAPPPPPVDGGPQAEPDNFFLGMNKSFQAPERMPYKPSEDGSGGARPMPAKPGGSSARPMPYYPEKTRGNEFGGRVMSRPDVTNPRPSGADAPGANTDEDARKRQVLIEAIMRKAFGG